MSTPERPPETAPRTTLSKARAAWRNARHLLRHGRLGPGWRTPFEVVFSDPHATLRRYAPSPDAAPSGPRRPVLLVPPLMVTAEIYDISPEASVVARFQRAGLEVHVVDFGDPSASEGGLSRTLDDHVLAVSRCVDALNTTSGGDVHLIGYSQGGLFCYQAAAYRQNRGLASLVAFGSPVDIHRNHPLPVRRKVAARLIGLARRAIDPALHAIDGLPGQLSAIGFKLLAPRQELRHALLTLSNLHDRDALLALEPRRRFLGGEGFIAWPGPALRTFIDEFVVKNRLREGRFPIAGRDVSLSDLALPLLCVVGRRDDLAYPAAVRAIAEAAPASEVRFVEVEAGHFGLIIGHEAESVSWPAVFAFLAERDAAPPRAPSP
jgi:putative long chain acyl-CoA synthase